MAYAPIQETEITTAIKKAQRKKGVSINGLAEALTVSYARARKILFRLVDAGDVKVGYGEDNKRTKIFTAA